MTEVDPPLLAEVKEQVERLAAELRQMGDLRWQLAKLEFEAAGRSAKRLGIVWAISAVLALIAVPLIAVGAVLSLPEPIPRAPVALMAGCVLLGAAILGGWWAWWRFRRQFVGLEETLEELREDLVWLKEWIGQGEEEQEEGLEEEGPGNGG